MSASSAHLATTSTTLSHSDAHTSSLPLVLMPPSTPTPAMTAGIQPLSCRPILGQPAAVETKTLTRPSINSPNCVALSHDTSEIEGRLLTARFEYQAPASPHPPICDLEERLASCAVPCAVDTASTSLEQRSHYNTEKLRQERCQRTIATTTARHACCWVNCQAVFDDISDLQRHVHREHMVKPGSKRPQYCLWRDCFLATSPTTPHLYTRADKYAEHMRVHTGERPYVCTRTGCTYSSGRLDALRSHFKNFHHESGSGSYAFCVIDDRPLRTPTPTPVPTKPVPTKPVDETDQSVALSDILLTAASMVTCLNPRCQESLKLEGDYIDHLFVKHADVALNLLRLALETKVPV